MQYLPVGTRVCAHWSPQYRCFYPGSVIESEYNSDIVIFSLVNFPVASASFFPLFVDLNFSFGFQLLPMKSQKWENSGWSSTMAIVVYFLCLTYGRLKRIALYKSMVRTLVIGDCLVKCQ